MMHRIGTSPCFNVEALQILNDFEDVVPDPALAELVAQLPRRPWIFTASTAELLVVKHWENPSKMCCKMYMIENCHCCV